MKKDVITPKPQWWTHLREFKRVFWKKMRHAYKKGIRNDSL